MALVVPLPERLGHILGKFRDVLSKSQFENFQSVMFGLIVSHCKEHDVKSIRDAISETKCQSSINRFFTSPSWSLDNIMKRAEDIVFSNLRHNDNLEFVVIDDSICERSMAHIQKWYATIIQLHLALYSAMTMLQLFIYLVISTYPLP
jgi:hypothetical protein